MVANFSITKPIKGKIRVPGDKSISHRALILASCATGVTNIEGLLLGEDVLNTSHALEQLGVEISSDHKNIYQVKGLGVGGLKEPDNIIDFGNSGTGVRLLMGLVSSYDFTTFFTGDESLRRRPMARVAKPLEQIGAKIISRTKCQLPIAVIGNKNPVAITYRLPIPSAQVKSAILLAGLNTRGKTTVIEDQPSRDHTERMLKFLGAEIETIKTPDNANAIILTGQAPLSAKEIKIPGDPSSAAFLTVSALLVPESDLLIENVCVNPLRTGLYKILKEMGGYIEFINQRESCGELIADIHVKYSKLRGVSVEAEMAPTMIDEYPILAIAAGLANGKTIMKGISELRVKESDRLSSIVDGLKQNQIEVESGEDWLVVNGTGQKPSGNCVVKTNMDHRIAMSFLIMGLVSNNPVRVDDISMIKTSFPNFFELYENLGVNLTISNN